MEEFIDEFTDAQERLIEMRKRLTNILKTAFPGIYDVRIEPIEIYCYECGELDDIFTEKGMRIEAYTQNPQELVKAISDFTNMHCVKCEGYGRFNSEGKAENVTYTMEFVVN